ncbi:glucose-6-phosphate isomerase [Hyphomonas neptunium ATCC 15444]|uniref:Glucose-6-phosphate isomerase n=2 Tax=Hyphomonas TaxID=85 RepID=Q0C1F5_HYPNA|nr:MULTISPECIES: glucose-6-phosphate isomerase [Hyphomonas]ABI76738.1 glucose-6-phosphate isomerase [Hyphomonas neptunium ATCC 15444]KCZ92479.1 glucose-6-phosphate isomerase [Hyphomonas hirschiana VP5]
MRNELKVHAARLSRQPLKALSAARAGTEPLSAAGWKISLARHFLDTEAEQSLLDFGAEARLTKAAEALFGEAIVNPSEGRPALHWALRAPARLMGEAESVRQSVIDALEFAGKVQTGEVRTAGGEAFTAVLHIGIGGSDFGPRLIADAFEDLAHPAIKLRFAANVDPYDLDRAMAGLKPENTLVVGVSKSFGTEETLYNLGRARRWLEEKLGDDASKHLALVTANPDKAKAWLGGRAAYTFDMPISVGGRFSLWSAASLACMIYLGPENFRSILNGANEMDEHVRTAPLAQNAAMRLALLDFWNTSIREKPMRVLLAYANRLRLLPTYLQQLEMESNGKSVDSQGNSVAPPTAPALWGGEGSVGQHSYHQWLHQGSQDVPCEFILAPDYNRDSEGLDALTAHALAQAEVLANGRSIAEVRAEEPGISDAVAPQKVHAGGRPSTLFSHASFGPEAFGALVALYEHRTYFAGQLWGLNPFDQWGVERGKTMAGRIKAVLKTPEIAADPVTAALLKQIF